MIYGISFEALVYTHLIKCLANRPRFDAVKQQKCEIGFEALNVSYKINLFI